jgi:hypothetical protein
MGRGNADNVKVIGKLTLVVNNIDERTPQVVFVANPNIVEYRATPKSQSVGFESIDETRLVRLSPSSEPIKIEVEGTVYTIALDSIGTTQNGRSWAYCDFLVSWDE